MVDLPRPILAVVYTDGIAADRFIADLGYSLRDAGLLVAGLVQLNSLVRDPARCDMEIEELSSGTVLQLSEHRGKEARGCRLDRGVLAEAAALLTGALARKPEVLVLNKFGKTEAEGGGVRDVLARAVEQGVPLIVGVPFRNLDQWRLFADDLAQECQADLNVVRRWLASWNLALLDEREVATSAAAVNAVAGSR
jgi:nucleoside-triphosphatase THEP1